MKKRLATGLLAAALLFGTLPTAALAAEGERGGLTIAPRPENVTIAPKPADRVTRSMAVSRLWELSGRPQVDAVLQFTDVTAGSKEAEAIRWASAAGITAGYTDAWFGGGDAVTREQLAAMIYRFVQRYDMGFRGAWMFYLGCEDLQEVQDWAMEPMYWMVASRLYDGSADVLLRPRDAVTAEELEAVLSGLQKEAERKNVDFTAVPTAAEQ